VLFWISIFFSYIFTCENEIIMNALKKTKEDLVKELHTLQKEYTSLKASYEKYSTEHKGLEDTMRAEEELIAVVEQFNDAQHLAMIGSWEWDLQTNLVWWSDETYRIFGVNKRDFVPSFESNGKFIHPEDVAKYGKSFEHSLKTGEPLNLDIRLVSGDGLLKHCNAKGKIVYNDSRQPVRFTGTIMDVSGRKKEEDALLESEIRYRRLFESAKDGILIIDAESGMIRDVNPFLIEMLGYSKDQFLEKTIWDIGVFKDVVANQNRFKELQQMQYVRYEDLPLETADGRTISVEFVSNVYLVDHHQVVQCNVRDITKRKMAENKLWESEEKWRKLVTTIPDFIGLHDLNGRYIFLNHYAEGFSEKDVVGKSVYEFISEESIEDYRRNFEVCIHTKQAQRFVYSAWGNNRDVRIYEGYLIPISENDQVVNIMSVAKDITESRRAEESLLQEQYLMSALMDNLPDHLYFKDKDSRFIRNNRAHIHSFGLSDPNQLVGKSDFDFFTKEVAQRQFDDEQKIIRTGQSINKEEFTVRIDSSINWYYSTKMPLRNKNGDIIGTFGISRDITDRKNAEEKLWESEQRLSIIYNTVGTVIFHLAVEAEGKYRFISINQAFCDVTGLSKDQVVGKMVNEVIPEPSITMVLEKYKQAIDEKKIIRWEETSEYPKGLLTGEVTIAPVFDVKGNCTNLVGSVLDITERKQTEEMIRNSEERFRQITENAQEWIWEVDSTGLYTFASQAAEVILGYQPEEIIGIKHFYDFFLPEERESIKNVAFEIFKQKQPFREFINRNISKDGRIVSLLTGGIPILDPYNGNLLGYRGVDVDITERLRAEQELFIAKEKAEESDRLKSAFLANMSHEIRTPMNGILGFADLLKEPHLTDQEQQQYISIIEKSGKRMLKIINDIVSISKIESGQMEVSISETNINQQIGFIRAFFEPESERKGLQLLVRNTLPSKECLIKTDREKLYAILTNLVGNALKFTSSGSIEFGVEKKGEFLEFFVKDTGKGVAGHQKEIIFERFRQAGDLTSRYNEGAGLGLSISKAYVQLLGGKIWLESESGKGSTFYFTLPYNSVSEDEHVIKDVPTGIRTDKQIHRLKILIAEDDETSVSYLSTALKTYCKEILTAGTGVEAVETCRNNPDLDLVLMDIRMSVLDGYEATRQIRQFNKNVIIIAQTAYAMVGDREKAIEAGCDDHIAKPIRIDSVRGLMQKYFNNCKYNP